MSRRPRSQEDIRRGLEAAFALLEIRETEVVATERRLAISKLAPLARHGKKPEPPPAFRQVSRAKALAERNAIAAPLKLAARRLRQAHAPVLDSVAKQGMLRSTASMWEAHAVQIVQADLSHLPEQGKPGPAADPQAQAATRIAMEMFRRVTEARAVVVNRLDAGGGPFCRFLDAVFFTLDIKADAAHYVRHYPEFVAAKGEEPAVTLTTLRVTGRVEESRD